LKGKIKQLKDSYGFISKQDSKDWIWFSFRGIANIDEFTEGSDVEFEMTDGQGGKKAAKNVKLIKSQIQVQAQAHNIQFATQTVDTPNDIKSLCSFEKEGKRPHNDLFSAYAQKIANTLAKADEQKNSPTQLRKFYDQVVRYYDDVRFQPSIADREETLSRLMPYILKLESTVFQAYEKSKIDANFKSFIDASMAQLRAKPDFETLKIFKTLFEAVLGFYKTK
jgi:CRISPR-associated protein Csm2